jgi:hypothetical protein
MLENEKFAEEHPNIKVVPMITLFSHCQKRRANSLQEAYEHAYGKDGKKGCFWCHGGIEKDKRLSQWAS